MQVQHFLSEPRSQCQGYSPHTFHWSPQVLQCGIASTMQRRPSLPKGQGNSCWLCLNDIRHLSILQGCQTSKGIPDSGEGKQILFSLRVAFIYSLSSCCFTESPQPPQIPITQAQVLCWHLQKLSAEGTFKQRPLVYLHHSTRNDQSLDEFVVWGRLV